MNTEQLRNGYQAFFMKHEAGSHFMAKLYEMIDNDHRKAETDPEHARDLVQRAKGIREVIEHITSLTAERKQPKT